MLTPLAGQTARSIVLTTLADPMAEVLSPIMSASKTITVMHARPSSAEAFQDAPQSLRQTQPSRSMYSHPQSYRGTTTTPVQPYAFQSTPHLRSDSRLTSSNTQSTAGAATASHYANSISGATTPSASAKDDATKVGNIINLSTSIPDLSLNNPDQQTVKVSPERYRRPQQRRNESQNSVQSPALAQPVDHTQQHHPVARQPSVDDMAVRAPTESAKRYRRRSLNSLDTTNLLSQDDAHIVSNLPRPASSGPGVSGAMATPTSINPTVFHRRTSSKDAVAQTTARTSAQFPAPEQPTTETIRSVNGIVGRADSKGVNVPPRTSSEVNKRVTMSSPLAQQAAEPSVSEKPRTYAAVASAGLKPPSPAAQQLAAVSDKDLNKGRKSRLRRAFSFGSSQELRRASAHNEMAAASKQDDELDPEQQEIARRQEAAGIGAGIYSGQGGFTGSTDNISISSTASSASLMLRKMGQSARKGARSIKGLFRPKSVIGVPAADGPVQPYPNEPVQPSAQLSIINVEAERQKVNVNLDPHDKAGGGTGFPKLERNSIDAVHATRGSADGDSSTSRRSIVGSDKDRAEILAAVKKGILKRSGTSSPVIRPLPETVAMDTPGPSVPGTPRDGPHHNDYFTPQMAAIRVTKSMPNTPNGSLRNISFSPRIQFHDAWSSTEYDRRGEIATCNRLTPMLAQQIKEELNNFKMVCLQ